MAKKTLIVSTPKINRDSLRDEFLNVGVGTKIHKCELIEIIKNNQKRHQEWLKG